MKAKISEIFQSIQGEGLYQGQTQVFVRFFGCNLSCSFCDTKTEHYEEKTVEETLNEVLSYTGCDAVSLTGGEPLLHVEFIKELAGKLKENNKTVYLETNGVLYKNLQEIVDLTDIIAMDFKLPTSTGLKSFWREHREFLKTGKHKEVFVKAVIGPNTQLCDIYTCIAIIKEVKPEAALVLQLQNPLENELEGKALSYLGLCLRNKINAQVMSQSHKKLGLQ